MLLKGDFIRVEMFNKPAYSAWQDYVWPLVKDVLMTLTTKQTRHLYERCTGHALSEYGRHFQDASLRNQLDDLAKISQHLAP